MMANKTPVETKIKYQCPKCLEMFMRSAETKEHANKNKHWGDYNIYHEPKWDCSEKKKCPLIKAQRKATLEEVLKAFNKWKKSKRLGRNEI